MRCQRYRLDTQVRGERDASSTLHALGERGRHGLGPFDPIEASHWCLFRRNSLRTTSMQARKSCGVEFDELEYDSRRDFATGAFPFHDGLVFHEVRETR